MRPKSVSGRERPVSRPEKPPQVQGCGEPSLTVVATPIGNLQDLSPRAAEALSTADIWFVEDSRVSSKLGHVLQVKKPMRVLNDHSTPQAVEKYLREIQAGLAAVVVSDGGTPVVSDPGTLLIDRCHDEGIPVHAVPGPSAVTLALSLSGFFGQRFAFLGFLGRKAGDIRAELLPFVDSPITLVLFESPHRIDALLDVAAEVLGSRRYAICREMTKIHEQVVRGTLPDRPSVAEMVRKGEFTLVFEGRRKARR
ncbi:MAG: 16S rRNA (cytidine(1402)-2'-O)-methyltransferase [Armatimonadetes bacterium]|nr:16S rRNA (cytidine(1402)-2'-O)-methyltransferase [Armatimonadota bacterium]